MTSKTLNQNNLEIPPGASISNTLPDDLKQLLSVSAFKKKIKSYSFASTTASM